MICTHCGNIGKPKTPGHFLVEVVLWCCFLLPGFLYSIWRFATPKVCPMCKAPNMVPEKSPIGRKMMEAQ